MPQTRTFSFAIEQYAHLDDLPRNFGKLMQQAMEVCANAYSPYSKFQVGAAILLGNGQVVMGNNQENAAYPSGMCAERTAFYWAGANYPEEKIMAVAIAAKPVNQPAFVPVTPCGACRQAMSEYETKQGSPIRLIMQGPAEEEVWVAHAIADLLPIQFSASHLKR